MRFQYYLPPKALQNTIAYYWTLDSTEEEAGLSYRFIPDGFVEWIFHLEDPWTYQFAKAAPAIQSKSHVLGHFKQYMDLKLPQGPFQLFAVKFYPWVAQSIWKIDLNKATNQYVEITDLPIPAIQFLQEQVLTSSSMAQKIQWVNDFLLQQLSQVEANSLKPVIQQIWNNSSSFSLKDFTLSQRRLEQRFKTEIGISPKFFQRTIRINQVIQELRSPKAKKLTNLGYDFNYADQAHFIHDFKSFTGVSPRQFLKNIQPDGDIFNLQIG